MNGTDLHTVDILTCGPMRPANPGALIESDAMKSALERAGFDYDLVLIDTPPLVTVSDALPLLGTVDGVVVIGRVDRSPREPAEQLRKILERVGAPALGIVANGTKAQTLGSYGTPNPKNPPSSTNSVHTSETASPIEA